MHIPIARIEKEKVKSKLPEKICDVSYGSEWSISRGFHANVSPAQSPNPAKAVKSNIAYFESAETLFWLPSTYSLTKLSNFYY